MWMSCFPWRTSSGTAGRGTNSMVMGCRSTGGVSCRFRHWRYRPRIVDNGGWMVRPSGTWWRTGSCSTSRSTSCTGVRMAEEQFTSRRARREAERLAAEQAFEAREVPGQSDEAQSSRADLLSPRPPRKPDAAPGPAADDGADSDSRIDPDPSPRTTHERGALASDHPLETRPPVHAED